mmetsp:Transcript_23949/g.45034  ORF Transcript_23949/g.45034 Transcript_23949/m.45034 type:complete len:229 (-) Transcript_23949:105-791(-)
MKSAYDLGLWVPFFQIGEVLLEGAGLKVRRRKDHNHLPIFLVRSIPEAVQVEQRSFVQSAVLLHGLRIYFENFPCALGKVRERHSAESLGPGSAHWALATTDARHFRGGAAYADAVGGQDLLDGLFSLKMSVASLQRRSEATHSRKQKHRVDARGYGSLSLEDALGKRLPEHVVVIGGGRNSTKLRGGKGLEGGPSVRVHGNRRPHRSPGRDKFAECREEKATRSTFP